MSLGFLLIAAAVMAALGALLSLSLAIANKKLFVFEDPRIGDVEGFLPSANCGACGLPGCHAFAESVVHGKITPANCTVNTPENREQIAEILGVNVGNQVKRVARLACAGGNNVARQRAIYQGQSTCRAANLVAGGGKGCAWGCLGLGDCELVCQFGSITMNANKLPVVDEATCTACGDCVKVCPKQLFSIHPVDHKLFVACKSEAFGDLAERECEVACTACGRCAADLPAVVSIRNNLAVIDYSRIAEASAKAIERCPTGAIVWVEKDGQVGKGPSAKIIHRTTPLPVG